MATEFRIESIRTITAPAERLRRWATVWRVLERLPKREGSPAKDLPSDGQRKEVSPIYTPNE